MTTRAHNPDGHHDQQPAPSLVNKRLAIVLSTASARDWSHVDALARAGCAARCQVAIFVMSDAIDLLTERRSDTAHLLELGCDVIACAASATARQRTQTDVGVTLGSQDDHAAIVDRAHRVVAFT